MTLQQQVPVEDSPRVRRAAVLDRLLREERWTSRQAATALGLTHTYVGRRRSGDQDLTFEDIELFAGLLKLTPEALFAELRDAEKAAPVPPAGGVTPIGVRERRTADYKDDVSAAGELIVIDFGTRSTLARVGN